MFQGQTSLGEVYDVCSGVTVAARMTLGQPAPSVAAAGVPLDALPPIEHAPGFVRYEVGSGYEHVKVFDDSSPGEFTTKPIVKRSAGHAGGGSLRGKRNRLRLNACATAVNVRAASAWPSTACPDC